MNLTESYNFYAPTIIYLQKKITVPRSLRILFTVFFLSVFLTPSVLMHFVADDKALIQWLTVEDENEKESSLEWTDDVKEEFIADLKFDLQFSEFKDIQATYRDVVRQVHQGYPDTIMLPPEFI